MTRLILITFIAVLCSCMKQEKPADPAVYKDYKWQNSIREDHPRLYFNKTSFNEVKKRALNEEKEMFLEMKTRIDTLSGRKIEFKEPLVSDGSQNTDHEYGFRAAESALLYKILGEEKYLDYTKDLIKELSGYYQMRNDSGLNVHWYSFSRIAAICAFDWIYQDLSASERQEIGAPLLKSINGMMRDGKRKPFFRENTGDYKTGFYGPPCLSWYAGLTFHKTGIDDSIAGKLLKRGYDEYVKLLEYRNECSGDDGGAATAVLGYCMGAYPWAEFSFFHTFNSATGIDISKEWQYVPDFLYYVYWNWLPGDKQFGYGDSPHFDNNLSLGSMHIHLSQMVHFYGDTRPEMAALSKWMQTKVKRQKTDALPFTRFLLTNTYENIQPAEPLKALPSGMHFKNMGQVFMRSGSGPEDTYALFTAGGIISQHRHYDNNNFIIYKKGFRALDTGTRPEPGNQLTHYFCRSVAHNLILINMPGEKMPVYWGGPALSEENLPIPNDGGQYKTLASEVVAYDENKDYVYVASDATASYNPDKSKLVLRQFLFLLPDHFVVFDRVTSTDPAYKKTWLLHTAAEPIIKGNEFFEDYDRGRLFCRTILPEKAELTRIGGPGKQFWSGGRNWPLPVLTPEDWNYRRSSKVALDTTALLGQWRVEVSPSKASEADYFLHLIQVCDDSVKSMVPSEKIMKEGHAGVRFTANSKDYEVMFSTSGAPAGTISISVNGQKMREEKLTETVKPQTKIF